MGRLHEFPGHLRRGIGPYTMRFDVLLTDLFETFQSAFINQLLDAFWCLKYILSSWIIRICCRTLTIVATNICHISRSDKVLPTQQVPFLRVAFHIQNKRDKFQALL